MSDKIPSIDTERKELSEQRPISRTTIHGWPAILFGLPFILAGTCVVLVSFGVISVDDSKFHVPKMLVAGFGGLFVLAGLSLMIHGIMGLRRLARIKQKANQGYNQTWFVDYPWKKSGIKGSSLSKVLKNLVNLIAFTIFLLPFNWFIFFHEDTQGELIPKVIIGIFDFVIIFFFFHWIYTLLRYFKYKTSRLRFNRFPFFLGGALDVTLETSKTIKGLENISAILQCIEERYEMRGSGKNRSSQVVSYQIYAETVTMSNVHMYQGQTLRLPLSFELPDNPEYETSLRNRPAKYWQLKVTAETPGIDYETSFLVPVYKK
jgi:hypothetical protein